MRTVQENFAEMPWRYDPECGPLPFYATYEERVECRPLPEVQAWPATVDKIAVYHFIVKSEEDFNAKIERGSGGGTHRSWKDFTDVAECAFEFVCICWCVFPRIHEASDTAVLLQSGTQFPSM